MGVTEEQVMQNFRQCHVQTEHVHFIKGYFQESLPPLRKHLQKNNEKIAVLRGDGDMFESYYDILFNLYEFVPVGGYFICGDCPTIPVAQLAIEKFREAHGITEPLVVVEHSVMGSYWRKTRDVSVNYTLYLEWNRTRTN